MEKRDLSIKLPQFKPIKPARRHMCGVCYDVFICHLCTLGWMHPAHRRCEIYICLKCAKKKGIITVHTIDGRGFEYNYETGRIIK